MFKKKIKINEGLLLGILIYMVFISILYFRMKNAENILADYYARMCPSSFDCRNIISAEILDYGSNKASFTNYGTKGIPVMSGTFEKYTFKIIIEDTETKTIIVLPNALSDISGFDMANVYIPTKSDANFLNGSLFNEKTIYVEVWRGDVTSILAVSNMESPAKSNESQAEETVSIGSASSFSYETVVPTESHPVILAEFARKDFNGWTSGLLFVVVFYLIFGAIIGTIINGMEWIRERRMKNE